MTTLEKITPAQNIADAIDRDWPEPKPVLSVMSVPPEVLPEMLPDSLRDWCFDAADRMQSPVDYVAVAALTMLGSLIGRQLAMRPKAHDSWSVKANIWAMLIGDPATMKTPSLKEARHFLDKLDRAAADEFDSAMDAHERMMTRYDVVSKNVKAQAAKAKTDDAIEAALNRMPDMPEPPIRTRYYSQDSTVEKLQQILKNNSRGILVMRDELVGFLRGLDKPGQEGSRAFFLEGWEGDGRFLVDRIGRGSSVIDGLCLGVLGNATPGGVSNYVTDALGNGEGADGLLQRFSLIAFPNPMTEFQYTDRRPDDVAADIASHAFSKCAAIDHAEIEAECYDDSLPFLRYSTTAQHLFERWYTALIERCRRDDDRPAIQSHLLKFTKLVPALSLICHVADGHTGPVDDVCFARAMAWARYAEGHARRLYASALQSSTINAAMLLLKRVEAGDLKDGFTARDVYRQCWTGLADPDAVEKAIHELLEAGHLRRIQDKTFTGGRPTWRYRIHPNHERTGEGYE